MTDQPASDALALARWLWPDAAWNPGASRTHCLVDGGPEFSTTEWPCIHAAEAVLIERGLAEEYGRFLVMHAELSTFGLAGETHDATLTDKDVYRLVADAATAPLPARLRALAAVVRAQEARR